MLYGYIMKRREEITHAVVVDVLVDAVAVVAAVAAVAGKRTPEVAVHNAYSLQSSPRKTGPSCSLLDRPSMPSSPPSSTCVAHSSPPQDWVSGDIANGPASPPSARNSTVSSAGPDPSRLRCRRSDGRHVGRSRFSEIG